MITRDTPCSLRQAVQWRAYDWQPLTEAQEQNLDRRPKLIGTNQGHAEAYDKEQSAKSWLFEKLLSGLLTAKGILIEYEIQDDEDDITEQQDLKAEYRRQQDRKAGYKDIAPKFWDRVLNQGKIDWDHSLLYYTGHRRVEIPSGVFRDFHLAAEYEEVRINLEDLIRGHSLLPDDHCQAEKGRFSPAKLNQWFKENQSNLEGLKEAQITKRVHSEFSPHVPRSILRDKIKELGLKKQRGRPQSAK